MSMVMTLHAVRDETRRRLLHYPPLIWRVLDPADDSLYESACDEFRRNTTSFWGRLFGRGVRSVDAEPLVLSEGEGLVADLDKSWHGLNFLFTGSDEEGNFPLDFLITGGTTLDHVDVGYGPARVFAPEQVAAIWASFSVLSDDALLARYDGSAMKALEIYPDIWGSGSDDISSREYLRDNLASLRAAVAETARRRFALVAAMS